MLKRTALRRYLMALLWHDNVPQSAACETGFIWTNCNGERADIFDHETHEIFENADAPYELRAKDVAIIFNFENVIYQFGKTESERTEVRLNIDIVAHDASGRKRQDILDVVEERIYHRILSYATFDDATTGETMQSFMRWIEQGSLKIEARDDSAFRGNYTRRGLVLSFMVKDCIRKAGCDDEVLCFDLSQVTRLDGDCQP